MRAGQLFALARQLAQLLAAFLLTHPGKLIASRPSTARPRAGLRPRSAAIRPAATTRHCCIACLGLLQLVDGPIELLLRSALRLHAHPVSHGLHLRLSLSLGLALRTVLLLPAAPAGSPAVQPVRPVRFAIAADLAAALLPLLAGLPLAALLRLLALLTLLSLLALLSLLTLLPLLPCCPAGRCGCCNCSICLDAAIPRPRGAASPAASAASKLCCLLWFCCCGQFLLAAREVAQASAALRRFPSALLSLPTPPLLAGLILILLAYRVRDRTGSTDRGRRSPPPPPPPPPPEGDLDVTEGGFGAQQMLQRLLLGGERVLPLAP